LRKRLILCIVAPSLSLLRKEESLPEEGQTVGSGPRDAHRLGWLIPSLRGERNGHEIVHGTAWRSTRSRLDHGRAATVDALKSASDTSMTGTPAPGETRDHPTSSTSLALAVALRVIAAGPLFVLICIWIAFAVLSPYFFTSSNLTNVLEQATPVAVLALGALVVVVVGSLDISLGATVGLCTIVGAALFRDHPSLGWLVVPAMLAIGLAIGALNSFIIVGLRVGNAFIVTLGMLYVVQSLSLVESGGTQIAGVPDYMLALANRQLAGIPGPIILVLVAGAALAFVLNRIVWGRWIIAIGGSVDAASKVGIPVRKVLFSVYVISSLFAAIAGVLVAGLNDAGVFDSGGTSILQAIAAVVIGGASLSGGRGSVWATIVGAVILSSITNGLALMSVSPNWTPFAVGAVLIIAVGLDRLRNTIEDRLRVRQAQVFAEVS
jgi:ribose transport system permease protein